MDKKWLILCLVPFLANAATPDRCDMSHVLLKVRPGAAWSWSGPTYKGLKWLDKKQKKPAESELNVAQKQCVSDDSARQALKAQARLDVKNPAIPTDKKVQDLILLLDLDK